MGKTGKRCGAFRTIGINPSTGTAVYAPDWCNRRGCPVCSEHGWVQKEARGVVDGVQTAVHRLYRTGHGWGSGWDGQDHQLRLVTGYVSMGEDDAVSTRASLDGRFKKVYRILKDHGVVYGWVVAHPFRGGHHVEDMDYDRQSLHFHFVGLAYFTRPSGDDEAYHVHFDDQGAFGGVKKVLEDRWTVAHSKATYMIEHCGWIDEDDGSIPQAVRRFGRLPGRTEDEDRPPAVHESFLDPQDPTLPLYSPASVPYEELLATGFVMECQRTPVGDRARLPWDGEWYLHLDPGEDPPSGGGEWKGWRWWSVEDLREADLIEVDDEAYQDWLAGLVSLIWRAWREHTDGQ